MKSIVISIIIAGVFIGGAILISGNGGSSSRNDSNSDAQKNNVSIENGKQIIDIFARGGYTPRKSSAKSGIPSIIRITTKGSFDCSIAVSIPSIGYRKNLSSSSVTDIELPAQPAGSSLQGICAMGMYNFVINFN